MRIDVAQRAADGAWMVWRWNWATEAASWWDLIAVVETESEAEEFKPRRPRHLT